MRKTVSPSVKQAQLKELNSQIAERQAYLVTQEKIISETIETGNTQLMCLNHDIALATQELKDLKTDIRNARRDKSLLTEDLEVLRQGMTDMTGRLVPAYG